MSKLGEINYDKTPECIQFFALIPQESIQSIILHFERVAKVATGVICNPSKTLLEKVEKLLGEGLNKTPSKITFPLEFDSEEVSLDKYRVVQGTDSCKFCELVRKSPIGKIRCWWADRKATHEAFQKRETISYQCHMGLQSLVAPIIVGGRSIAGIYGSQVYTPFNENELRAQYDNLEFKEEEVSWEEFREARENTPYKISSETLGHAQSLLSALAEDISRRATWKATLNALTQITKEIGLTFDRPKGLDCYLRNIAELLSATSGGIWLLDSSLQAFYPAALFCSFNEEMAKAIAQSKRLIPKGKGIVGKILSDSKEQLLNKKEEIDAIEPCYPEWRETRNLHSILGVPMQIGDEIIGVLEMGSDKENMFCHEDIDLLKTFATHASLYVRSCEERTAITSILSKRSKKDISNEVVNRIPKLVHGEGCSIFLRKKEGEENTYLLATTGLVGYDSNTYPTLFYKPNEGMTGWVLAQGKTMVLRSHKDAKTRKSIINKHYPGAKWKAKYCEITERCKGKKLTQDVFAGFAFLAVPLKTRNGLVIGVLRISNRRTGNFSLDEVTLVEACAKAIAVAVEEESIEEDAMRRAWRETAGAAAHRIGNRLPPAQEYLALIREKYSNEPATINLVERAEGSIRNALRVIIEFKKFVGPCPIQTDLVLSADELVKRLVEHCSQERPSISISQGNLNSKAQIRIDWIQLQEVFSSFIEDSIRHKKIDVPLKITISCDMEKIKPTEEEIIRTHRVCIIYEDTGAGIPCEIKSKIFEPFFTTSGGTGLGLTIARQVIEANNGEIRETGIPGKGVRFEIFLPQEQERRVV